MKKQEFGEAWRKDFQVMKSEETGKMMVSSNVGPPKVIDSIDINNFFVPIEFYTDPDNKFLKMDFDKYEETEEAYKDALEMIDKELRGEVVQEEKEDIKDNLSDIIRQEEEKNKKIEKKVKVPKFLQEKYRNWTKYFQRFVPLYNRHICSCCGQILDYDNFFPQYVETNLARIEPSGKMHQHICKDCSKKLYEFLFFEKAHRDPMEAMKWYCSYLNIYFDEQVFYQAKKQMEDNGRKNHIVYEYLQVIGRSSYKGRVFLDSSISFGGKGNESGGSLDETVSDSNINNGSGQSGWTKEDIKNRKLVIKMVGYDVFDYESDENRKQLYRDLLGILEQGMEMDQVKLQAGIQIVISYLRVRELNKLYRKKEQNGASVTELKALSELKAKEMNAITSFSKDNGFSERYATAKAKGENSFTGIMNKMDEQKYEDALVNRYDIMTSSTIQQAAEASFKAIMSQLSLGEAEVWQTCQKQLKLLEELRRDNDRLTEELRKAKYEIAEIRLGEEAKKQGVADDDLDDGFEGF